MRPTKPHPTTESPGVIDPQCLYRLDELGRRLRLGVAGMRTLRRERGLRVHRVGGRGYCLGSDAIAAITAGGDGAEDAWLSAAATARKVVAP